jgi:hypothetical protein
MSTFAPMICRDLACGTAAALITLIISLTFLQSTGLPPGAHHWPTMFGAVQPQHAWFGQPEPAVLVD